MEQQPADESNGETPVAARVTVEVAPEAMLAQVVLEPASDGTMPTLDEVHAALAEAGVVLGIDETALRAACRQAAPQRLVAAVGMAPQPGEDTRFEVLVDDHQDRTPRVDQDGLVDFRDRGEVPVVVPGQPLMRRVPPTPGVDGWTVQGKPVPATPGRDEPFTTPFQGAERDPADENLLRASCKGQPVRVGNAVIVEQVFHAKSVDMASGNVTFDGTVQVDGDVLPGLKVQAGGDILVRGTVEGGVLEAAGDIRVAGGAIARARLKAGGSVGVRFAESATIQAGQAIAVDDMALHSELQAGVQITVGAAGSRQRGRLAGGRAQARMLIVAPYLGAASVGTTRLRVGVDPVLEQRLAELVARMAEEQTQGQKLSQLVQLLKRQGDPKGMLPRAQAAWQQAEQVWGKSLQEKVEIEAQLAKLSGARVQVGTALDGDIELVFGQRLCRPRDNLGAGVFSVRAEDGLIVHTDPNGLTRPVA